MPTKLGAQDLLKSYAGTTPLKALYAGSSLIWQDWTPASFSGLVVWLDAKDYSTGVWTSKGSGAQPAFVGTPMPVVSSNTLNGLPLVRFKANEGRLRIASAAGMHQEWTAVYVGRLVGPTYGRVLNAVYAPNNLLIGFWNAYEDVFYDNGFGEPNTQTPWTTNWHLYSGDGTLTPSRLSRFYSNGVLMGTTAASQGWGNTLSISGYDPTGIQETADCEVAEVLVYNRKLSDADRQQVEGYLRTKWGLP